MLSTSPIAGQKIRDIEFPESVLIGGILKKGEFIKPSGGTLIEEGDTIALFTMAEDIPEVERLLQVSIDFFKMRLSILDRAIFLQLFVIISY